MRQNDWGRNGMVCTRQYSTRLLVHFHSLLGPLGFLLVTTLSPRVAVLPAALTFVLVRAQIAKFAVSIKVVVQSARLGQAVWWRPLLCRLGILVRTWFSCRRGRLRCLGWTPVRFGTSAMGRSLSCGQSTGSFCTTSPR